MMIRAALEELVLSLEGCCAAVLLAHDGVAVDSVIVDTIVDPELVAAEVADIVTRSTRVAGEATGEPLDTLRLETSSLTFVARPAAEGFFLLAVLQPGVDAGWARSAMGDAITGLAQDLDPTGPAADAAGVDRPGAARL